MEASSPVLVRSGGRRSSPSLRSSSEQLRALGFSEFRCNILLIVYYNIVYYHMIYIYIWVDNIVNYHMIYIYIFIWVDNNIIVYDIL